MCCIGACGEPLVFERNLPHMPLDRGGSDLTGQLTAGCLPRGSRASCAPACSKRGADGSGSPCPLGLPQIDRGGLALIAALELEAHSLAFVQIADTGAFYRRDVYEHILRAVLRLNEAVTLLGIKPLYGPSRHFRPSQIENSPPLKSERRGHTTALNGERSGARSRSGRQAEP